MEADLPLRDRVMALLAVGFAVFVVGGCGSSTTSALPAITVVDREGLLSELEAARGAVVVLNFWATWCGPCVEELPHFARLAEAYGDRGVRVIAVSFDDAETLESRVRPFVEEKGYPFTYMVKAQTNGDQYEAFINAIDPSWRGNVPATFVYDSSGKLRASAHDSVTYSDLQAAVEPLLSREPSADASTGVPSATAMLGVR